MKCIKLKKALDIISKYIDLEIEEINVGHDTIYLCYPENMSKEDKKTMEELGFLFDEESECYCCFV